MKGHRRSLTSLAGFLGVALVALGLPVLVATAPPAAAQTPPTLEGEMTADEEWDVGGSPYILTGDLEIPIGVELRILPGVVVKIPVDASIVVEGGALQAYGTGEDHIVFTSVDDHSVGGPTGDGDPTDAHWEQLYVGASEVQTRLSHVEMRWGGHVNGTSPSLGCWERDGEAFRNGMLHYSGLANLKVTASSFTDAWETAIRNTSDLVTPDVRFVANEISNTLCGIQVRGGQFVANEIDPVVQGVYVERDEPARPFVFWANTMHGGAIFIRGGEDGARDIRRNNFVNVPRATDPLDPDIRGQMITGSMDAPLNWWGHVVEEAGPCVSDYLPWAHHPQVNVDSLTEPSCDAEPSVDGWSVDGFEMEVQPALRSEPTALDASRYAKKGINHYDRLYGDPVSVTTGSFIESRRDLDLPGQVTLGDWTRTYNSIDDESGVLGAGWSTILDVKVSAPSPGPLTDVDIQLPDGADLTFVNEGSGDWDRPPGVFGDLAWESSPGVYRLDWADGRVWSFDASGRLVELTDWRGESTTIDWSDWSVGGTIAIRSSSGYGLDVAGVAGSRITSVTPTFEAEPGVSSPVALDDRAVNYGYTDTGEVFALDTVSRGDGLAAVTEWTYGMDGTSPESDPLVPTTAHQDLGLITEVHDGSGRTTVVNEYGDDGEFGRVTHQWMPAPDDGPGVDWAETSYDYSADDRMTTITDEASGDVVLYTFDEGGRVIGVTDPASETTDTVYDSAGNLVATRDRAGHGADVEYDADGNPVERLDAIGNASSWTYDAGRLASTTERVDGLIAETTYEYAAPGDRIPSDVIGPEQTSEDHTEIDLDPAGRVETMTDADGVITAYAYDDNGNVETITVDPGGFPHLNLVTTYAHDEAGRMSSVTAPDGRTTSYEYDPAGRVTSVTEPTEDPTVTEYNADGTVDQVTDPLGAVVSYTYDPDTGDEVAETQHERVVPTGVVGPVSFVTTKEYDDVGDLVSQTRPGDVFGGLSPQSPDATATFDFGILARLESSTVDPGGLDRTTSFGYDVNGNRTSSTVHRDTDPDLTTLTEFDGFGRPTQITNPAESSTRSEYNEQGQVITSADATERETRSSYDTAGRLIRTEIALPGEDAVTVEERRYTPAGRLYEVENGEHDVIRYGYDAAGRQTSVTKAPETLGPLTTTTFYDEAGRVVFVASPGGRFVSMTHDVVDGHRVETMNNGGSGTWQSTYNERDELISEARFVDEVLFSETTYAYDDRGNLVSVTDPNGNVVTSTYDGRGNRLTRTSDPGDGAVEERWIYNAADEVVSAFDQLDRETTYAYDEAGRLELVTDPSSRTQTMTYRGDGAIESIEHFDGTDTLSVSYGYDEAGRRTSAAVDGGAGATLYEYDDAFGGMTRIEEPDGDIFSIEYDDAGRRERLTYPDETEVTYAYDEFGRLYSATHPTLGETLYLYDADGNLLEEDMPDGQYRRWSYDPRSGKVELYDTEVDGVRRTSGLAHDALGRLFADWTDGDITIYGYDAADQLTSVHHSDSLFDSSITGDDVTYEYDGVGNRTARIQGPPGVGDGTEEIFTYDDANQLVSSTSEKGSLAFDYDAAGRMVALGDDLNEDDTIDLVGARTDIGYDPRGLPAEIVTDDGSTVVTEDRTYDAVGNLVGIDLTDGTTDVGIETLWDESVSIPQIMATTTTIDEASIVVSHLYGLSQVAGGADRLGITIGGIGSVHLTTDAHGSTVPGENSPSVGLSPEYDEWGNPVGHQVRSTPAWLPGFGYRGEMQGMLGVHLRNRDYSPSLGVFTTPDPLDGVPGTTTEANRYPYAANDPVGAVDPLGLRPDDAAMCEAGPVSYGGAEEKTVSETIAPQHGRGLVRVGLYIPTETAGMPGVNAMRSHGDDRGPCPYADLSRYRAVATVDYEAGQAEFRVNPSCGTGGAPSDCHDPLNITDDFGSWGRWFQEIPAVVGDSNRVSLDDRSDGSVKIRWAIINSDKRTVAPTIDGSVTLKPAGMTSVCIEYHRDAFPALEAYQYLPGLAPTDLLHDGATWGADRGLLPLPFTDRDGSTCVADIPSDQVLPGPFGEPPGPVMY